MQSVREKLKDCLLSAGEGVSIRDIRIGLGYTAVMTEDGRAGLAATLLKDLPAHCDRFDTRRLLGLKYIRDLIAQITSDNHVSVSVALAAANAVIHPPSDRMVPGSRLPVDGIRPGDRVGMVGHFSPMVKELKEKAAELLIFEQIDQPRGGLLPAAEVPKRLPECQVALITATSIINGTLDDLLAAAKTCRETILLGASTPLLPEVFQDTPVTCLSGAIVTDPEAVLKVVSCGGGMRSFKPYVRKVNLKLNE